jgi:hypothetical protein
MRKHLYFLLFDVRQIFGSEGIEISSFGRPHLYDAGV